MLFVPCSTAQPWCACAVRTRSAYAVRTHGTAFRVKNSVIMPFIYSHMKMIRGPTEFHPKIDFSIWLKLPFICLNFNRQVNNLRYDNIEMLPRRMAQPLGHCKIL